VPFAHSVTTTKTESRPSEAIDIATVRAERQWRQRSAHPSIQPPPPRRQDRPTGALSFGALRAVVVGLSRVQQPLPVGDEEPGQVRRQRVLGTAFYDAWLVTWPPGSNSGYHGHGDVRSVVQVIDGELVEIYSDDVNELAPLGRMLRHGDSTYAKPSYGHDLANRSEAEATTLHVFSPPLLAVTRLDPPSVVECERLSMTAQTQRVRQANAEPLPTLRPPPLALVEDAEADAGPRHCAAYAASPEPMRWVAGTC
jgi:uncharacterized RmlC-like cupin family protein